MKEINQEYISTLTNQRIKEIGLRIKSARKSKGYTQQHLAFSILSDKCLISSIEAGNRNNITLNTLIKISFSLDVNVDYLITGK